MKNYHPATAASTESYFLAPQDTFFLHNIIDEIYRTTPLVKFKSLFSEIAKIQKKKKKSSC